MTYVLNPIKENLCITTVFDPLLPATHVALHNNTFLLQLEKLITKNFYLFKSAKDAYRAYIQAYASHSLKTVFVVDQLDLSLVAKSFGFQVPPAVNLTVNSSNKRNNKSKADRFRQNKKQKFSRT